MASDTEHIKNDVATIKVDLRRQDDKLTGSDKGLNDKIDALDQRLCTKIDAGNARLSDRMDALQRELSSAKLWAFGLYVAQGAGLLFVMAKGFKWF